MLDLNKFGNQISAFRNGTLDYNYSYNSVGGLYFKSDSSEFNECFLKLNVENLEYNYDNLEKLYPVDFQEFVNSVEVPTNTSSEENSIKMQTLQGEVDDLKLKLQQTSTIVDEKDRLESQVLATKDVIIQLRIANGEGKTESDFSSDFPYTAKTSQ